MKLVAVIEAAKGALVLLAGVGLLSLLHRDVQAIAEHVVRMGHLNPAAHYPRIFIDAASRMTDARLWAFAAAAGVYAVVRAIEAYGLWHCRSWAEWFALVAGGMYLPVEIFELFHRWTWIKFGVFGTNLIVVAYMAYALLHPAAATEDGTAECKDPERHPVP